VTGDSAYLDLIAVRSKIDKDDWSEVFNRQDIRNAFDTRDAVTPKYSVTPTRTDKAYFQGCCIMGEHVYIIEGDTDVDNPKVLQRYNLDGSDQRSTRITRYDEFARSIGKKREPEGLAAYEGELYTSFMVGRQRSNIKLRTNLSNEVAALERGA